MIDATFVCESCGNRFRAKIFEPGEAEKKRAPQAPVRCPECGGPVRRV
jgi:DNA-directed RNA polymerase subunit RPC12/RpoP